MGPTAHILPDGARLHLQHGPIDLIIGADGERQIAFEAATARFAALLDELVAELAGLRDPMSQDTPRPVGRVAGRMHDASLPYSRDFFVTRMAAVAGAVADEVLDAMMSAVDLRRAYVNNGGDISFHLTKGEQFNTSVQSHDGQELSRIAITSDDPVRGIATSGRHGRSLSFGIADSVTVLATTAAQADVAATLIANAVDLPGHTAITRRPAIEVIDDSDLGMRPVVIGCAPLSPQDCKTALQAGRDCAEKIKTEICSAGMFLQGHVVTTNARLLPLSPTESLYA